MLLTRAFDLTQLSPRIGLCYGCNQSYVGAVECPQCGQELVDAPEAGGELDQTTTLEGSLRAAAAGGHGQADLAGRTLGGYEFHSLAGEGGMARVYRGRHAALERLCAIKVLHPALAEQAPKYVEQFVGEARAAAGLVHPNIVTVHNIVEAEGLHMIEMEWVEGAALGRTLLAAPGRDAGGATRVMAQVAAGLAAAHEQGLVHRDIKPSNVLVKRNGTAKLADFGLAKQVLAGSSVGEGLAGTPYFMAPELFRGKSATPSSDVYAAGVTYFYLLAGQLPFRAAALSEMARLHQDGPIPDVRSSGKSAPEGARELLARCLAKESAERFADGGELLKELQELAAGFRDLRELIHESLAGLDTGIEPLSEGGYEVTVALDKGRRQRVLIQRVDSELEKVSLLRISSPCAPVDDSYLRRALELNGRVDHGALAISRIDGRSYFVMRNAYPWATCDPEELRYSVMTIAAEADRVEELLLGGDRH